MQKIKKSFKYILFLLVVFGIFTLSLFYIDLLSGGNDKVAEIDSYTITETLTKEEFHTLLDTEGIDNVVKENETNLIVKTKDNKYYNLEYSDDYINKLALTGVIENVKDFRNAPKSTYTIFNFIYDLLFWGLIGFIIFQLFRYIQDIRIRQEDIQAQAMGGFGGVGMSQEEKEEDDSIRVKKITFDEVQGIDELKPDLYRLVDCLKSPEKYTSLGARLPKGVIFYGPPGTGKTLTAKALAGEAGVPFFSASGSDFIEKFVGVGASRIRELYKKARKAAPCIVFIDEIDSIGGGRGEGYSGEKDQTINALLTELDGFKTTEGVLTICATNRIDMLDPALMRAGRFDLKLAIELPDRKGRFQILNLHSKNKKFAEEVSLDDLAKKTIGFSGAELENLLNESALIAATLDKEEIDNEDLENAFFKIIMDGNKKQRDENDTSVKLVAYHEAGHTLATKLLTNDGVPTVTIMQSTSGAGGVTFTAPEEVGLQSKKYLRNKIKVDYAGRAAEQILLGNDDDITIGASQDIKDATRIIKAYIGNYGMGSKGMVDLKQLATNYDIVDEASELATQLYQETLDLLTENKDKLDKIALALLEKETLYEADIDELIA